MKMIELVCINQYASQVYFDIVSFTSVDLKQLKLLYFMDLVTTTHWKILQLFLLQS